MGDSLGDFCTALEQNLFPTVGQKPLLLFGQTQIPQLLRHTEEAAKSVTAHRLASGRSS